MQFLPTIAKQLGFSGLLVGTMYTVLPISGLIAKPLFGCLADKFKIHKIFFILFQVILTVSFFTINFIPEVKPSAKTTLTCDKYTYLELCSKRLLTNIDFLIIQNSIKNNVSCHLSCTITSVKDMEALCDSWFMGEYCSFNEEITLEQIKSLYNIEFEVQFNKLYVLAVSNTNIREL
jgi:hypothetical protein